MAQSQSWSLNFEGDFNSRHVLGLFFDCTLSLVLCIFSWCAVLAGIATFIRISNFSSSHPEVYNQYLHVTQQVLESESKSDFVPGVGVQVFRARVREQSPQFSNPGVRKNKNSASLVG